MPHFQYSKRKPILLKPTNYTKLGFKLKPTNFTFSNCIRHSLNLLSRQDTDVQDTPTWCTQHFYNIALFFWPEGVEKRASVAMGSSRELFDLAMSQVPPVPSSIFMIDTEISDADVLKSNKFKPRGLSGVTSHLITGKLSLFLFPFLSDIRCRLFSFVKLICTMESQAQCFLKPKSRSTYLQLKIASVQPCPVPPRGPGLLPTPCPSLWVTLNTILTFSNSNICYAAL